MIASLWAAAAFSLETRKTKQTKAVSKWEKKNFENLRSCRTVSDFLKVSGLNEIWLHDFEPPKELSDEDHHIVLLKVEHREVTTESAFKSDQERQTDRRECSCCSTFNTGGEYNKSSGLR